MCAGTADNFFLGNCRGSGYVHSEFMPSGEISFQTVEFSVEVLPSVWLTLSSDNTLIEDISSGQNANFQINI